MCTRMRAARYTIAHAHTNTLTCSCDHIHLLSRARKDLSNTCAFTLTHAQAHYNNIMITSQNVKTPIIHFTVFFQYAIIQMYAHDYYIKYIII